MMKKLKCRGTEEGLYIYFAVKVSQRIDVSNEDL